MKKAHIISEIRRTAIQNGGKPLGKIRFERATGIKEADWLGKIWARWSDVIKEAGFSPNTMTTAHSNEQLLQPLVDMIRELGHFPTRAEQRLRRRNDPKFPTDTSISRRWGKKGQIAAEVMDYCLNRKGYDNVIQICSSIATQKYSTSENDNMQSGQVYLLKHHDAYKIGKSFDASRRYKEIRTQMPHKTEEIHVIQTDDPPGIEAYWHNRFKDKRLKGEWFKLTPNDVKAFKRRKFM